MRNDRDSHHRPLAGREGRPHKDYIYSPVSTSVPQTANGSDTLQETQFFPLANPTNDIDRHLLQEQQQQQQQQRRDHEAYEMTEKGSRLLQYLGALTGNICAVTGGVALGWTSPVLPMLKESPVSDQNPLGETINEEVGSWIGSLLALGAAFGGLGAGFVVERYGRRFTLLASVIPFLIGWILIATGTNVAQLYIARLVSGFAVGFCFTALPMYVGEIAETPIRGALGSMFQMFVTTGLLYSYCIGPYVPYLAFWIACMCTPVVFFACFYFMPESPYFLLSKGRKDDAIASVARLRGKSPAGVQKEVDEMQAIVEEAYRNQGSYATLFTNRANFKALMYTCALVLFQQFSGINVVLFYTGDIFNSTGSQMSSATATIIVGVVMFFAAAVCPLVVEKLGRRILLIGSSIGMTITLAALGLYFFLQDVVEHDMESLSWLPVVSLVVYIAAYSVGWGPLAWAVMGELFASDVKSKASSITVIFCWFLAFCITKFFSNIEAALGTYTAFWIFAVFCVFSALFVLFLLPETKGKSLQQIQDELNGIKHSEVAVANTSSESAKY